MTSAPITTLGLWKCVMPGPCSKPHLASQLAGCSARATAHGGTGSVTCSKPSSNHDAWLYLWSCTAPACACLYDGLGRQNLRQFAAVIMHHWFHPHSRMHNLPKRTSAMQVPPWCSGWLPAGGTADQDHPQQQGPGCNSPATWYQGHLHSRCTPAQQEWVQPAFGGLLAARHWRVPPDGHDNQCTGGTAGAEGGTRAPTIEHSLRAGGCMASKIGCRRTKMNRPVHSLYAHTPSAAGIACCINTTCMAMLTTPCRWRYEP
jgi:hypothetical protein